MAATKIFGITATIGSAIAQRTGCIFPPVCAVMSLRKSPKILQMSPPRDGQEFRVCTAFYCQL